MNLFYLIGGVICLLSVLGRFEFWRTKGYSSGLKESNLSELIKAELTKTYHQITITLLVQGIALVLISIFDTVIGIDFLAILSVSIIIGQYLAYILVLLRNYRSVFKQTIPVGILYGIIVIVIILGIIF